MTKSNRNASFPLAVLLMLAALTPIAQAKASTYKIVIEGGGLSQAIEITNPQILNLSNVWTGRFIDSKRDPVNEPPRGIGPYEISFYVKFGENDIRKKYVLYYHPRSASEQGYIYFPGRGDAWQYLNWGTIMREGADGKWHYALPAWENLIKPLIARAESLAQYWR